MVGIIEADVSFNREDEDYYKSFYLLVSKEGDNLSVLKFDKNSWRNGFVDYSEEPQYLEDLSEIFSLNTMTHRLCLHEKSEDYLSTFAFYYFTNGRMEVEHDTTTMNGYAAYHCYRKEKMFFKNATVLSEQEFREKFDLN